MNHPNDLISEATEFAARAHRGQLRKGTSLPYIVHPMEVTAICATFTNDVEVLAAAVLHDTVEDTDATAEQLEALFGTRVARIVAGESEDKREGVPAAETWKVRKLESIAHMQAAVDSGVRMVCLGDKLSNIRSIQRDLNEQGEALWQRFNQKDPCEHAWYYRTIADALEPELGGTAAWQEYATRVDDVFGRYGA